MSVQQPTEEEVSEGTWTSARPASLRRSSPLGAVSVLRLRFDRRQAAAVVNGQVISETDAQRAARRRSTRPSQLRLRRDTRRRQPRSLRPSQRGREQGRQGRRPTHGPRRHRPTSATPARRRLEFVRASVAAAAALTTQADAAGPTEPLKKADITINPDTARFDRRAPPLRRRRRRNWLKPAPTQRHPGARTRARCVVAARSSCSSAPRVAPGLLTREAWLALEQAACGVGRDPTSRGRRGRRGRRRGAAAWAACAHPSWRAPSSAAQPSGDVVWVGSSDGDPGLTDAIAAEVTRLPEPPEVELLIGSFDVPGSRLLDLVAVMDRLRSPGGCPWDAEQTHESLVPYLLEEAHEAVEAIESGDRGAHARGARRRAPAGGLPGAGRPRSTPSDPFDIDDVAGGLVEKLRPAPSARLRRRRRRPPPDEVEANWERIKAQERAAKGTHAGGEAGHETLMHGIPASLPTLMAAEKVLARWSGPAGTCPPSPPARTTSAASSSPSWPGRARRDESAEDLLRAAVRGFAEGQPG